MLNDGIAFVRGLLSYFHWIWDELFYSEYRWLLLIGMALMMGLILVISVMAVQSIHVSVMAKFALKFVKDTYKTFDQKAAASLMEKMMVASGEADYNVKLGLMDRLDLKLIARSNIRSRVFFLNIYVLILLQLAIFIFALPFMQQLFVSWKTSIVVAVFLALTPTLLMQSLTTLNNKRTRHMIANFLTLLLGYLEVRNDLIYALENVMDDVEDPMRSYLMDAVAQLRNNFDPDTVFDILAYKLNSKQFFIIAKNFKSVFKNGGDIIQLVRVLEEEAYKIDNAFETRIVDTFTTRMVVHMMLFVAFFFLIGIIFMSPLFHEIYTQTAGGQNILFFATLSFIAGILLDLRTTATDT